MTTQNPITRPLKIYRASAGSGKTFTLAVEYIKLLIENPLEYKNILAVTFTNKATAEMKNRILSQLYGISKGLSSSDDYLIKIKEDPLTKQYDDSTIRQRAAIALQNIVHDYSHFRIETIDSFFQSVLRDLAHELKLSANLRVDLNDKDVIPEEWFDNALFFGDSLTSSLGGYTMYFGGLGEAQFVHKNGMACHHLTRDNEMVFYAGRLCTLAEIAELSGAGKLFIQLAMNDLGRPLDELEESWKTVIQSIKDRCPEIQIYIQSGTPVHEDIGRFSKQNMLDYNEMLKNVCEELGLVYVDIARGMADENGYMPVKLMNNNEHFNNNGCVIWIDNLRDSQSYSVRPDF